MDLNTSLTLFGVGLTVIAVWYARRGAVAAEEAVRVARIPFDREEKEKSLTPLERATLRAALDAQAGVIFLNRHFEAHGPHVVFSTAIPRGALFNYPIPRHEPIPDPTACVERLINLNYLEVASPSDATIGLTEKRNAAAASQFERIRITTLGREVASSIEESAPADFIAEANLQEFRDRRA